MLDKETYKEKLSSLRDSELMLEWRETADDVMYYQAAEVNWFSETEARRRAMGRHEMAREEMLKRGLMFPL
jgi:hypothetical protein